MRVIELCSKQREFERAHSWTANGKRITQRRFETLETLSQRTDCFLTIQRNGLFLHFKTVRLPDGV